MTRRLEGRVAIVTGAGRGLGRAEAIGLAREGARVVINDLGAGLDGSAASPNPADAVVEEIRKIGGEAVANYDDVSEMESAARIVRTATECFGRLDILINNAGFTRDRMIFNMAEDEWDSVIKGNLKGHFAMTHHACKVFRAQCGGRIVNTSSEAGLGNMGQASYSAAKEGIVGLTRTVALDMAKYGVTCNAIRPRAATRTALRPGLREARDRAVSSGAAGLHGFDFSQVEKWQPEHVVPLVVYLCTDEAAGITGRTFLVYGSTIGLYSEPTLTHTICCHEGWTVDLLSNVFPSVLSSKD